MIEWKRRILWSLLAVAVIVFGYSLIYQWAMFAIAGNRIGFVQALQVVVEALTTAGFGGDTDVWREHDALAAFTILMNLTGVALVFLALPFFIVPLFGRALQRRPAESSDLENHVVVCSYTDREAIMLGELEAADVPSVIVSEDSDTVLELNEDGIEAILGDFEQEETFRAANIESARGVVIDAADERTISILLTIRELSEEIPVVSVLENGKDESYHRYAGANEVIRPQEILGDYLVNKIVQSVEQDLQRTIELDEEFELSELLVMPDSDLAEQTFEEAGLRDRIGATVVGVWRNGEFVPSPDPDMRIGEKTILLVAGSHRDIEDVRSLAKPQTRHPPEHVVVVGYGVVGRNVVERLEKAGISTTVVDDHEVEGVDIVGDVTEEATISRLDFDSIDAAVLALDDDTETMYTTVALESLAPDAEVIARCNNTQNVKKLYSAGAEYVLSLSTVTGRMLAASLLEEEELVTPQTQFEILRTEGPKLAGKTLSEADVRDRTGVTIIAVERDGELITNPETGFTIREGDVLVVVGSDESVNEFIKIAR